MQQLDPQADRLRLRGVEGMQQEILPFDADHRRGEQRDRGSARDVGPGDAEHVAEQDMVEMHVGLDLDVEHEAKPEHAREDHAHHRVLLDPAVLLQEAGRGGADHAGGEGADRVGKAEDIGEDHAGKHGMADRIAHQRPALQHEEAGQERHRHGDDRRDHQRIDHEVEAEGRQQRLDENHHPASSSQAARRRAARRPCLGARRKAIRKIVVCSTTMMPPVAPSRK